MMTSTDAGDIVIGFWAVLVLNFRNTALMVTVVAEVMGPVTGGVTSNTRTDSVADTFLITNR